MYHIPGWVWIITAIMVGIVGSGTLAVFSKRRVIYQGITGLF